MKNVMTIARREFVSYFNSPIAYIVAVGYMITAGYMFFEELFLVKSASMRGFFGLGPLLLAFVMPIVTMRLVAEERREGTLELLLTMPVTDWEVITGKFLSAIGLIAVLLGLTLPFAISVSQLGPLDKGATVAGYVGTLFLAGGYGAIGLMCSAFTKNQIVAVLVSFFACLTLFLVGQYASVMPAWLARICETLSTTTHFQSMARGVFDSRDILYFASLIFGSLLVAQTTLESRRWR